MTIIELLEKRDAKARSAVWVNGKQLLLAEYPTWEIKDGDTIKILRVVAGG
ncbi:MAG: MoaD/ThiS family protein [Clostridia bacterium]|nr:MoaD/ThiS family protein [Clostridia bacterium]